MNICYKNELTKKFFRAEGPVSGDNKETELNKLMTY